MMEIVTLIIGVIGFITLIVFFIMASDVGSIRKEILKLNKAVEVRENDYERPFKKGELMEFLGKKEQALECYMESYFFMRKAHGLNYKLAENKHEKSNKERLISKIKSLGGNLDAYL